ncbi:helix-turn-helix domain-containing protein [Microbulbifer hainanensis]|uniref:helix-turn-helix domain-containing protein n=1 Tax=Microbulbifer hainanensis TaxID=2735675 RepID=UPI0018663E2E|nr:helix-turn-helix transcriptional regulator [Microbulbifer hainanensis]
MTGQGSSHQLGETMKLARLERRMSQRAVAEQLGIQQSYLSKVETDAAIPSVDILRKLCDFYGVKTHRLLRQLDGVTLRRNAAYRAHLQWVERRQQIVSASAIAFLVAIAIITSSLLRNEETASPIHLPVTLVLNDIDGAEAIDLFAAFGQLEVRGRDLVKGKTVSIEVRDIPWDQAFAELSDRLGVRAEISGALVELHPKNG